MHSSKSKAEIYRFEHCSVQRSLKGATVIVIILIDLDIRFGFLRINNLKWKPRIVKVYCNRSCFHYGMWVVVNCLSTQHGSRIRRHQLLSRRIGLHAGELSLEKSPGASMVIPLDGVGTVAVLVIHAGLDYKKESRSWIIRKRADIFSYQDSPNLIRVLVVEEIL